MEEGAAPPLPPATLEPISRPSSTSSATASIAQLPGVSALATTNSTTSSPQLRATSTPVPLMNSSPAAHAPTASGNLVSHQFFCLYFSLPFSILSSSSRDSMESCRYSQILYMPILLPNKKGDEYQFHYHYQWNC
ncbi:hypothetical protein F5Y02DRAFT_131100 [Annulohypoxylon stygium]|nr:hypothetical protein F5Y02DRAFT_131100 [Annulohypoxylon stygium]